MGEIEILNKLSNKLKSVPRSEEDIIYILSRIRKILEISNHPEKYSILNFYCNLSLHPKITKTPKIVSERMREILSGKSPQASIIGIADFQIQFKEFVKEYNLPDFYLKSSSEERKNFNKIFWDVLSDTPIKIENVVEYDVILKKESDGSFQILFDTK